ncbi:hypothetical protein F6R98_01745 [Candidatus Methylospira mobilis]|uniref:Uncharacterized protein n=1 Tax=Candidatus Methylospira mobilis TaxID=1808979 RepID=A0A5Q0BH59_9GAMM|nr:hypothetical protein [Candidatus Methylospira mobilis]QFY41504.1 hypothetical protein F6R98_01745 [Candidatus Methylospira mobilis]WNV05267.1 hypothetical protein RP726_02370 [Candidatus Methylospira mobilis]
MNFLDEIVAGYSTRFGQRHHLPEYRQIELYSKKKKLAFADEPLQRIWPGNALSTEAAFMLLETQLISRDPSLEDQLSWQRYLALPRGTVTEKLVAEVYRLLRIHHIAGVFPEGHMELDDGLLHISCTYRRCALALVLTPVGLELLESFVFYYLDSFNQPYSESYVEAMLTQYYFDIVGEVKRFSDEDRILYQFRQAMPMNRHFRFDSDHPRYRVAENNLAIEIGGFHSDPARYPIDFYLIFEDSLHIIPVEALRRESLPLDSLPRWRARTAGGLLLPDRFRQRFGRETVVVGLPMS